MLRSTTHDRLELCGRVNQPIAGGWFHPIGSAAPVFRSLPSLAVNNLPPKQRPTFEVQTAEQLALVRQIAQDLAAIRGQQELASLLGVPVFRVE